MTEAIRPPSVAQLLGAFAAVALPAASLTAIAEYARDPRGLQLPVFAEPGLLAAHCAFAMPLAWVVASRIRGGRVAVPTLPCALAGLALIGFVYGIGPRLSSAMATLGAGLVARSFIRSGIAMLLVLPWMLAVGGARAAFRGQAGHVLATFAAALLAILPPMTLAQRSIATRTSGFASDRESGRLVRAWRSLAVVRELGAAELKRGVPIDAARASLARDLRQASRTAHGAPSSPPERFRVAFALIGLEEPDRAEDALRPLVDAGDPDALLLLAALERDRGRWDEAAQASGKVLASQLPMAPRGGAILDRCSTAYDILIDVRFGQGRPREAALAIREALERLRARQSHFTFRLGNYEFEAGRPAVALAQFEEAVRLDSALEAQVRPLIHSIRMKTPACFLVRKAPFRATAPLK